MPKRKEGVIHELGKWIRRHRKERGVTLEELARKARLSQGNLSDIEKGKRDPRYSTLVAIAMGLSMSLNELLTPLPVKIDETTAGDHETRKRKSPRSF